jgi:hypothetical protein
MEKLEELIAALEKATGPDRDLDVRIAAALEPHRFDASPFSNIRPIPNFWLDKAEGAIRFEDYDPSVRRAPRARYDASQGLFI